MNLITMKLKYRKYSTPQTISIETQEKSLTCEDVAKQLSQKMRDEYAKYLGKNGDKKHISRWTFGQYKMILMKLEEGI